MTLNKRERLLLGVTLTVVALGLSWLLFVPLTRSYAQLGGVAHTQHRELDIYRAAIERVPEWRGEYDALRERLGQRVEHYEQMSDVLKKIDEVAALYGVVITTRKPLPEADRGVYRELPIQCRLEATTDSLVRFLFALRAGAGFINVEKLEVYSQANSNVLRCDVILQAIAAKSGKPAA